MNNLQFQSEHDLYLFTIAQRLQQKTAPFIQAADLLKNKQFFYLQVITHPECVSQANNILGYKKNYLRSWIQNVFVFEVFGEIDKIDVARISIIIQNEIAKRKQVVLSKEVYNAVQIQLGAKYNEFVLKATFDRIFYSPRVKEILKKQNKQLSNRKIIIEQTLEELNTPRIIRHTQHSQIQDSYAVQTQKYNTKSQKTAKQKEQELFDMIQ
ncbi:Hypothetical_protein [Hexamita inflata]|uniref:Hypothetical_protein n=1 Tax=Hexamita inflata TaxID=28002 RepID=A0AA86NQR2_9EUKA|nr:Hypothetical protein HINF_LOCUS11587 [Hexamita inflata]